MDSLLINEGFPLLSFLVFFPLFGAFVLFFYPGEQFARRWALLITTIEAFISLFLLLGFDEKTVKFQFVELHAWIPPWSINYVVGVDGISLLLVLLSTLIMPFCVLASWKYIATRVSHYMFCLLLIQVAMVGLFVALDFIMFWIFWEFMLIPMYLLIAVWGGLRKDYASMKFFIYTLAGSVLLLVAILALYRENGSFFIPDMQWQQYSTTFQLLVFLSFFLAFAIRVPMLPFHTWLPAAHEEAPAAVSVILASVLLNMGTYGMLRFCLPITPQATFMLAPYILWLSIAGIIYGGLTALAQSDMKKLIAYSSVGHMGFVTLGIFVLNTRGMEGALLQMINHGVNTGALFLCAGMIYERIHSRELSAALGCGRYMPWFAVFLGLFSLSSFAFPGTNSFIGEFLILAGTFELDKGLALAAVPGAVLAAAYMLRMLQKLLYGTEKNPDLSTLADLSLREVVVLAPFALFVFWIGLGPQPFVDLMHVSITNLVTHLHTWQNLHGIAPVIPW